MSPALWGSAQTSAPSLTCQPGRTPSLFEVVPSGEVLAVKQELPAGGLLGVGEPVEVCGVRLSLHVHAMQESRRRYQQAKREYGLFVPIHEDRMALDEAVARENRKASRASPGPGTKSWRPFLWVPGETHKAVGSRAGAIWIPVPSPGDQNFASLDGPPSLPRGCRRPLSEQMNRRFLP